VHAHVNVYVADLSTVPKEDNLQCMQC